MAYNFQDRLRHNKQRFEGLNPEAVTFTHAGVGMPILASPIFKRAFTLTTMGAMVKGDRQYWSISRTQGDVSVPEPVDGDTITRANGDTFRITQEDENLPAVQNITSARDRFIVYSVLESQAS
jgi:hypothetical protein